MQCDCLTPCKTCKCLSTLSLALEENKTPASGAPVAQKGHKRLTPVKAIRAKCLDCCNGSFTEVKLCPVTRCALYLYRLGRRPSKGGGECGA